MNITVFGASGEIGKHLVTQALGRGHSVRAVARVASTPGHWGQLPRLEVLNGDVQDSAFVAHALTGQDAVLSALGLKRRSVTNPWSALVSPTDFASRTAQHITGGMQKHGITQIVCVSAAGVAETYPGLNPLMKFFLATSKIGIAYTDLARMEDVLRSSGLNWVACRPTRLIDGPASGKVRVIADGRFALSAEITRADVAGWMIDALEGKVSAGHTPTITGEK